MEQKQNENRPIKNLILIVFISVGLMFINGCKDRIQQIGEQTNLDGDAFTKTDEEKSRRIFLKLISTDCKNYNNYLITLKVGKIVIYNGNWIDDKLIELTIPESLNEMNVSASIIFYKEQDKIGYYFEPKASFYLHKNDNMIFVILDENNSYSDFPLIGSTMIR